MPSVKISDNIRMGWWVVMLVVLLCPWQQLPAQEISTPAEGPRVLRMASISTLVPGSNAEDARLALEIIMQQTIVRETYPFRVKLDFISDFSLADTAVARGRYHFVILTGLDYLSLIKSVRLTPIMIPSKADHPTETLFLVMRKDTTLTDIKQAKQRILMIDHGRPGEVSRMWADTLLWRKGYPSCDGFFTHIKSAQKVSQLLLSVFFGQADACIISASAFAVMAELNPQIGIRLAVIERSPELVMLLLCATDQAEAKMQDALLTEALSAETNPAVRQALTIVQMKRFIPFNAAYFSATESLVEQYRQLAKLKATGDS